MTLNDTLAMHNLSFYPTIDGVARVNQRKASCSLEYFRACKGDEKSVQKLTESTQVSTVDAENATERLDNGALVRSLQVLPVLVPRRPHRHLQHAHAAFRHATCGVARAQRVCLMFVERVSSHAGYIMMSSLAMADVLNGAGFLTADIYRSYLILQQVLDHLVPQ